MEAVPQQRSVFQPKGAEVPKNDSKYIIHHLGPMGTNAQQSSAAAFFARTHKSSPIHSMPQAKSVDVNEKTNISHISDFSAILSKCPPIIPPYLLKKIEAKEPLGMGKVRVVLRVANSGVIDEKRGSFFKLDKKKRQVTLFDPSNGRGCTNESSEVPASPSSVPPAPKMFAFDGLFTDEDPQIDLCASALVDPIHAVVQGTDAALFSFGHSSLGKTYTMIGSDESSRTLGVIPTAISWLFKAIKEKREKTASRFSVRVSALEIGGSKEEVRDLLSSVQSAELQSIDLSSDGLPPSAYLAQSSTFPYALLPNQAELRCPSAEKAGDLLDAALTSRSTNMADDAQLRDSHFVFTLHVYQYSVEACSGGKTLPPGVIGGRSRLHLVDFGNCDRTKSSGGAITLSGLGNVLLSIFNGQRHLPYKDSKVTHLLKECLGSLSCQATMLAHVSPEPSHYSETLHTTQLASRIHRMRRKKAPKGSTGSAGGSGGSGSSDENKHRFVRLPGHTSSSSDFTTSTDPSSSEQSCNTVIYLGSHDDDGTDAEHPPVYIPSLNSGDNRGQMAKALRGSTAEMPKMKSSTLERKRSKERSPSASLFQPQMSSISQRQRPGSVGSTPTHNFKINPPVRNSHLRAFYDNHPRAAMGGSLPRYPKGKMPLTGKVAGYRQAPSSPHFESKPPYPPHLAQPTSWGSQVIPGFKNFPYIYNNYPGGQPPDASESVYSYGYMDDHKKMMIQQWVECQTAQMHVGGGQKQSQASFRRPSSASSTSINKNLKHMEPEPFAWLKNNDEGDQNPEVICLTQFKTADSSDDSVKGEENDRKEWINSHEKIAISVDVHPKPKSASSRNASSRYHSPKFEVGQGSPLTMSGCEGQEEILSVTLQAGDEYLPDINEIEIITLNEDEEEVVVQAVEKSKNMPDLEVITSKSSEENLATTVKALDVKSLHYVKEDSVFNVERKFAAVSDDVVSLDGGEDYFSKKLDQLAKLHELYQSVSSINAKCQSHLEASREQGQSFDLKREKGSSFSLSALGNNNNNNDNQSVKSEASSSEVNSLCSEPAKMYDYSDFLDGNKDKSNITDLCMFKNGLKFCMSLGDLEDLNHFDEVENDPNATQDRSDSPVLEGIDRELAKYAKLKDLKHAYVPLAQKSLIKPESSTFEEPLTRRHPEGASDPDLNRNSICVTHVEPGQPSRLAQDPTLSSRRSPGNGCSGSEPDEIETHARATIKPPMCPSTSPSCSSSLSSGNGNAVHHRLALNGTSNLNTNKIKSYSNTQQQHRLGMTIWERSPSGNNNDTLNQKQQQFPHETIPESAPLPEKKGPKFSRLFKLSRSPLKITTDKKRSKSADTSKTLTIDNNNRHKSSSTATPTSSRTEQKKLSKDPGNGNKVTTVDKSKNVKGTSSSESSRTDADTARRLHSSTPVTSKKVSSSTSSRGSDSGHESGTEKSHKKSRSSFIKSCTFVKLRSQGGRGATKTTSTSTSASHNNNKKKNGSIADIRATHCKSSGYESGGGPGFDSEQDSVNSLKGAAMECVSSLTVIPESKMTSISLVDYDKTFISRLDNMQRFCIVKKLQKEQKSLKVELQSAKQRINADPKRWSFDLHIADNSNPEVETDPSFMEALKRETLILNKRVEACKSHSILATCFDFCPKSQPETLVSEQDSENKLILRPSRRPLSPLSQKLFDNCCTTDCELLIVPTTQETDIF